MSATSSASVWEYTWTVSTSLTSTTATVSGTDLAGNVYSGSDSLTFTITSTAQAHSLIPEHSNLIIQMMSNLLVLELTEQSSLQMMA